MSLKEKIMTNLLSSTSNDFRFHTLGKPDLKRDVFVFYNGNADVLTGAQLIALTLNEICVLEGKGQVLWYPSHQNNVIILLRDNKLPGEH